MRERQRNRNRFFNAKNITIGSGLITILGKMIYDDIKRENSFIKNTVKRIFGSSRIKITNEKNVNNPDSEEEIVYNDIKKIN